MIATKYMTAPEARAAVAAIRTHAGVARALVLDLHERQGWRALGYASWRDCVVGEFGECQSQLYAALTAAKVERALISGNRKLAPMPVSHLTALKGLPGPESQRRAFAAATERAGAEGRPRTTADVAGAADAELDAIRARGLAGLSPERKAWAVSAESDRLEKRAEARERTRYRSASDKNMAALGKLLPKAQRLLKQLADEGPPRFDGPAEEVGNAAALFDAGRDAFRAAWEILDGVREEIEPGSGRRKKVA